MFSNLYVRGIRIKHIEEDSYYKYLPAIKYIMDMDELQFNSNVTFLVGENGIGKSTLIEAIAVVMSGSQARNWWHSRGIIFSQSNKRAYQKLIFG